MITTMLKSNLSLESFNKYKEYRTKKVESIKYIAPPRIPERTKKNV